MNKQLSHHQVENSESSKEIIVISENIRTPENVGMIFRISEAFGVKKVILVGQSPELSNKKVLRTSRSTEKEIDIQYVDEIDETLQFLKTNNYHLVGVELSNTSKNLTTYPFSEFQKIALVVGAERFGIADSTLHKLDACVHINLFGKNSSINVVNALGITLFEITR